MRVRRPGLTEMPPPAPARHSQDLPLVHVDVRRQPPLRPTVRLRPGLLGRRRGETSGVGGAPHRRGCPGPEVTRARPGLTSCHSMTPLHARNLLLTIWTGPATPPGPTAWGRRQVGWHPSSSPEWAAQSPPRPQSVSPKLTYLLPPGPGPARPPAWLPASSLPTGPEDSPERALPLTAPGSFTDHPHPPCPGPSPRPQPGGHGSQGLPLRTGQLYNLPHKLGHFPVKGTL